MSQRDLAWSAARLSQSDHDWLKYKKVEEFVY